DNISPDPNDEYLADGMTDEMISKLSKIGNFRVIARTSVMRYKESAKSVAEIGEELSVGALLEGSVRKVANTLRINVQLVDVETQAPIWSKDYNRQLEDVFDIQDDVSRAIVEELKLTLSPREEQRLTERPIENIHAYESYIRARQAIAAFDVGAMQRALREVQNALEIVGDNELLYSTMGWLYAHLVEAGVQTTEDYYEKAEELADKVFDLDPNSFYGYALQGKIHNGRGNTQEAVRNLKRAYSIEPNNPDVLLQLSYNYIKSGNSAQAKLLLEKLLEIDPLTPLNYNMRGLLDCMEGRFKLGLEYFSKGYDMDPESPGLRLFYAWFLAANKRIDEACSVVDLLAKDSPQTVLADLGLFFKHALRGEKEEALQSLTPPLKAVATNVEYLARVMADGFALIDDKERAIYWLENSVNLGFIHYPYLAEYDPFLENVRGEESFQQLMQKVKYRWENFEI
ncbi:MAG: tetratricopeptide repeat protein, partial [bacterium]